MSHVKHRPHHTGPVRVIIRVRPGAGRDVVGGEHDGALVVRVGARAVDGKATAAALTAVAEAFGVRPAAVTLVTGATSTAARRGDCRLCWGLTPALWSMTCERRPALRSASPSSDPVRRRRR